MKSIIIIFLFLLGTAFGQVLDNSKGLAFTDEPFFNSSFIMRNGIESINGKFVYKKTNQGLRETNYAYVYSFDTQGRLISTFETRTDDGTVDTTWNIFEYDVDSRIIATKKGSSDVLSTTKYVYDENGRVSEQIYLREYKDSNTNKWLEPIEFNHEYFKYDTFDLILKKTVFNSYNLPYKEEFSYYNEDGYLLEVVEKLKMTGNTKKTVYSYNDKGFIEKISTFKNKIIEPIEEVRFKYDEFDNVMEKHIYKNGVFITDVQIIYNSKSKLMSSVIIREVATNFMMIIRFKEYNHFPATN